MKKTLFLMLILVCFSCGPVRAEDYKFSMLPRFFPERLTAMTTPLVDYLSQETGNMIELALTENFAKYEAEVLKGTFAIAYQNPLVYVNVSRTHEVVATAVKGTGTDKFRGIIIARPDSEITKFADLKGKKIMIVGKTSAGGFLSQKLSFQKMGLDVDRDCQLVEAAGNQQENVIIAVSIGDVDAGFIRESALHKADEYIMPGSVKTIIETAWLPNWALSVNRNMPEAQKKAIRTALLKLNREDTVMQAMQLDGFKPATDADYEVIRKLIN
ncbi:MAG: phosphate/phosphite/phosphonate ABC transporter substrate-binding protein [Desulforhopalus sp.]